MAHFGQHIYEEIFNTDVIYNIAKFKSSFQNSQAGL